MKNELACLIGKTLESVKGKVGDDLLVLRFEDGDAYQFKYYSDCCASCTLDDVVGDWADIIGSPILMAEEVSNNEPGKDNAESFTWTFYKLATVRGYVTLKWYGESNGYYSESVTFEKVTK